MSKAFKELGLDARPLAAAMPAFCASIPTGELRGICEQARARKARLVALWGSDETTRRAGYALHLALGFPSGLLWVSVPLSREDPHYPGLADIYPSANRMQRATADLLGIVPSADADRRKWLRHGAWPEGTFPLRKSVEPAARFAPGPDRYPFVPVEGEKILRLEERLGYKHKGIEKRFEQMTLEEGAKLAGRVSGDSTVAYAWAYAMAVEGATGTEPPSRALALRGILLELERIANHLGDLGYLGNDVSLSFGFFQFWRLKEDLLRTHARLFGHRYLMDAVVPGGVAKDLPPAAGESLAGRLTKIEREVANLKSIYDEHAGAQDRFIMTGQ